MSRVAGRPTASGRLVICLSAFFTLTSFLAYTNAARGTGHWDRLDDPWVWMWIALATALFGFWGYLSIMLSVTRKTAMGRKLFTGTGLSYLAIMALNLRETFSHDGTASIAFQALAVPAISTIVMGPLLLLFAWIGNAYGKPYHD